MPRASDDAFVSTSLRKLDSQDANAISHLWNGDARSRAVRPYKGVAYDSLPEGLLRGECESFEELLCASEECVITMRRQSAAS